MEIMVDASQLGSVTSTEADGLSLRAQLETVQSELRGPISEKVIESPPSQSRVECGVHSLRLLWHAHRHTIEHWGFARSRSF